MTHLAPTTLIHSATADRPARPSLITRLLRSLTRTTAAMEGQARLTAIGKDTLRDTRLSPEDLSGAPTHDPALPFFLQSGFGRSDR